MCLIAIRYDEIIEMEADFLLNNLTPKVSQDFDDAIELIVTGSKPYSGRALAFTIKRLRNEDSTTAWNSLKDRKKRLAVPVIFPANSPFDLSRPKKVKKKGVGSPRYSLPERDL